MGAALCPSVAHRFGGQLSNLNLALADPFQQYLKITLIGDSITWGSSLPENGASEPRDGTGSDPRDVYASGSWANEFKRWIGQECAEGAAPVLTNWAASPSGESIATFSKTVGVFVDGPDFVFSSSGSSLSNNLYYGPSYPYAAQRRLADGSGGTSTHKLSFTMTGKEFSLVFGALASGCLNYTVWVNGVQRGGTYSTTLGEDGNTSITRRHHALSAYTVGANVEIRTAYNAGAGSVQALYLYGVEFRRKIVISNNGINGSSFRSYNNNMLSAGGQGDGLALSPDDAFVIIQLGTNDRGIRPDTSNTLAENKGQAQTLINSVNAIAPNSDVILMVANAATQDGPPAYKCTMRDIRQMVLQLAKDNAIDCVDNYQPFARPDIDQYLADGLHPNRAGHALIARNLINAVRGV